MSSFPEVGAKAPAFSLTRDGGGTVSLKDFKGRKLVVYFYPKADTPGCTKEAIAFNGLKAEFAAADTDILGVSADEVKAQDKFRDKYSLGFALGSDPETKMAKDWRVWVQKSLYGREYMGLERATFLVNATGTIEAAWHKVKVPGHVEAVLEAAQSL